MLRYAASELPLRARAALSPDTPRSALAGPEIILASTNALTLAPGARIEQTGSMVGPAEKLLVNGDGLLLRVSGRDHAPVERSGLTGSATPTMTIGADAGSRWV